MNNTVIVNKLPTLKYKEENLCVGLLENVKLYDEKVADNFRYLYLSAYYRASRLYPQKEPSIKLETDTLYSLSGAFEEDDSSYYYDYDDRYKDIEIEKCKFISAKPILEKEEYKFTVFKFQILENSEEFKFREMLNTIIKEFNKGQDELKDQITNVQRACDLIYDHLESE